MSYKLKKKYANKNNYGAKRSASNIKYIVIHYTANDGDTDEGNANYFASRIIKGALKYEDVVNKYPQYKEDINSILMVEYV